MPSYRLTRAAGHDLAAIFRHGLEYFGLRQADDYHEGLAATFAFLAEYPRAARERREIAPPVRIHPYKAHLIVYEIEPDDSVLILRIRDGREDWLAGVDKD